MITAPICNVTLIADPTTWHGTDPFAGPRLPAYLFVVRDSGRCDIILARETTLLTHYYAALVTLNGFQSPNNC